MTNPEQTMECSDFKDRKTGLVVFGTLQIILGGVCALLVPLMVIGMVASAALDDSPAPPIGLRTMLPGMLLYLLLAVWFIWMGIGSLKARRWARSLILVSSWLWLICGIYGFVFVLLFMSGMYNHMAENGRLPRGAATLTKYLTIGFMTIVYIIIPGLLVLFYGSKNVKATCEFRDSKIRWTDKCPLPVLAVSLIFAGWAISMLSMGGFRWTIPFFGFVLSGIQGATVALVVMLLCGYVAWGLYKLDVKAWWCTVLIVLLWALSAVITFSRVSMLEFYEQMNFPEQQLEAIKQSGVLEGSAIALFFGLSVLGLLGYLLYTKKYFPPTSAHESAS